MAAQVRLVRRESATSRALYLHLGLASTLDPVSALMRAVEAGDWNAARRLNAEMAAEFPATAPVGCWFLQRIGEQWGEVALAGAKREWREQQELVRKRLRPLSRRL